MILKASHFVLAFILSLRGAARRSNLYALRRFFTFFIRFWLKANGR